MAWLAGEDHPPDMLTKALPPQPIIHLRRELRAWGGVCKVEDLKVKRVLKVKRFVTRMKVKGRGKEKGKA